MNRAAQIRGQKSPQTHLDRLYALRSQLESRLAAVDPGQTASLSREYRDCLTQIAAIEKMQPRESVVDDLARKRDARRAVNPAGGSPTRGDSQAGTS